MDKNSREVWRRHRLEKLRESFKDSTVLIIAHRLATVIDADRILVMNGGRAEEYDHPYKLLVND